MEGEDVDAMESVSAVDSSDSFNGDAAAPSRRGLAHRRRDRRDEDDDDDDDDMQALRRGGGPGTVHRGWRWRRWGLVEDRARVDREQVMRRGEEMTGQRPAERVQVHCRTRQGQMLQAEQ